MKHASSSFDENNLENRKKSICHSSHLAKHLHFAENVKIQSFEHL